MDRDILKRLAVKGAVSYTAVILLILTAAMPAVAVLAAGSVNSAAIIDRQVKTRDIGKRAVTAKKLAPKSVKPGKIAPGAVRSSHIKDGSVTSDDIASIADSKISHTTKTGRISVPPAALAPYDDTMNYIRGASLINYGVGGNYFAPVSLPDGAVVKNLFYQAKDEHSGLNKFTRAYFDRVSNGSAYNIITTGTSGAGVWETLTNASYNADAAVVDNASYAYYVRVYLPDTSLVMAGNMVVEFTYTSPGH